MNNYICLLSNYAVFINENLENSQNLLFFTYFHPIAQKLNFTSVKYFICFVPKTLKQSLKCSKIQSSKGREKINKGQFVFFNYLEKLLALLDCIQKFNTRLSRFSGSNYFMHISF